ncbi:hypothetical protein IT408_04760 [Candidatus Uhrbacteria bacterium]|nr:hypothetical protein [Candidatus Uhrbacteria bacterium]
MDFNAFFRNRLLRFSVVTSVIVMSLIGVLMIRPGFAFSADASVALPPVFPCAHSGTTLGTSPGATVGIELQYECHIFDYLKDRSEFVRKNVVFGVIAGLLDSFSLFTQMAAAQVANYVYSGFDETPQFYSMEFGDFLKSLGNDIFNRQLENLNENYFKTELGLNICQSISLNLKLALGVGRMKGPGEPRCTYTRMMEAFNTTKDSLSKEQLAMNLKQSVSFGGNSINVALSANQVFLQKWANKQNAAILDRQEGQGFKNFKNLIDGNIKQPSQVARDSLSNVNNLHVLNLNNQLNATAMIMMSLQAGLWQLPSIAAGSFANTIAVRGLSDLMKYFESASNDQFVYPIDLTNEGIDTNAESGTADSTQNRRKNIISQYFSDLLRPNMNTGEQQDFTVLMSTCPQPRGLWGCSMDNGLASALRGAGTEGGMTVGKAAGLLPGSKTFFLHPDWELIPEWETKDNQDPGCYQRAYCATNLAKLRFSRILPIGWELAANSVYNKKYQGKYITLGQVIAGFTNCNSQGEIDEQHPWCKLINPAWILTTPPFKCSVEGFTDTVIGGENQAPAIRVQECVDVVSCLTRDDKGNCIGGYGYCAAEKMVWRFGGDQCDERFSSCRSFKKPNKQLGAEPGTQTSTNEIVSYVRNTIDYGACTADNSGCLYYLTLRDVSTSTADVWRGSIASNWKITDSNWENIGNAPASRIYFDKTVKTCDASNDGCTKLYTMEPQTSSLNLLQNSSFEVLDEAASSRLQAWQNNSLNPYVLKSYETPTGEEDAFVGSVALDFEDAQMREISQVISAVGNRYYTMSLYGKNRVPGQMGAVEIQMGLLTPYTELGKTYFGRDGKKYTLLGVLPPTVTFGSDCQASAGNLVSSKASLSDNWGRETCSFTIPNGVTGLLITIKGKQAVIDAVQVEEGQTPTEYVDGVNTSLVEQHLKIAPEELACTGVEATDRAECGKYARVCSQIDAGCQAYHEVDGDGSEIPANLSRLDFCPESCVGYAEYRKQPTAFDLTKNTENAQLNDADDDTVANFIPTNALTCTADAVGCEEFTSVENQAAGGESKAYFSYVRACELPGQNSKTFFTWEGSDQTGYQLRTWSLIANGDQPKVLAKAGPDGFLKAAANCNAESWKTGTDLDCRQFYNESGAVYYIYYSQTVLSTSSCTDYRISFSNIDDCTKTGGNWNSTAKQCFYSVNIPESALCPQQYAGCRGYVGTNGKNYQTIITDTFSGAKSAAGFVIGKAAYGEGSTLSFSQEALLVGDNSLKVTHLEDGKGGTEVSFTSNTGSLYMVSFWAKSGKQNFTNSFVAVQDAANNRSPFRLTTEWKRYELGPFSTNKTATDNKVFIYNLPKETYIDEVKVKQLRDVEYVAKDTWVIPAECDRTTEGVVQPLAMLGCRAYQDRNSKQVNVRQFNNLCKFETVGCTGYVDTRNSADPYVQQFAMKGLPNTVEPARKLDNLYSGTVTTTRPADRNIYVIDAPSVRCDASQDSCRAFGKPTLDPAWKQTGTQTVYLIDDITKYVLDGEPDMMCRPSELFCDTFVSDSVVSYFRDPQEHACTWKDKVTLSAASALADDEKGLPAYSYPAGQYSGWFMQSGTSTLPCYPHLLSNANTFLVSAPMTNDYQGWTANCPKDQSECTEFRDSNDHSDSSRPVGKPYYFINNGNIDKSTCGDVADPFNGCVLIRDTNDATLRFNAKATYAESHAKGDIGVTPLDCAFKDKGNPFCVGKGICLEPTCAAANTSCENEKNALLYAACTTDADCVSADSQGKPVATARCEQNDSNRVIKVKLDRDCKAWFGCRSGETVYDDTQQKYVDLCTEFSLCDRSGGSSQGNYCGNYLNRTLAQPQPKKINDPYYEKVLREGVFMNDRSYSMRKTEFGDPDYSGYTIANRFQMADLVSRRVGYEILRDENPKKANEYFDDYRFVASIPLAMTDQEKTAIGVTKYGQLGWAEQITDPVRPKLHLCQHKFTKQVGYFVPDEEPKRCYLAIDTPLTQVVTDVQGAAGNSRNAQTIATVFAQDPKASHSSYMNQVMPGVECKAYPDAQAPFSNDVVKEWDTLIQPNVVKTYIAGFDKAAVCERGEDCSCQYAKANYGEGLTKYLGVTSKSAPPQGVCFGGSKNGQACIPNTKLENTDENGVAVPAQSPYNEACGANSICRPLEGTSYVRGTPGYCIQRDSAVTVGAKGQFQCLTWSPQPVLSGTKDVYHYSPTVGYNPPLNSGEYYCVNPSFRKENVSLFDYDMLEAPGKMSHVESLLYRESCTNGTYKYRESLFDFGYAAVKDTGIGGGTDEHYPGGNDINYAISSATTTLLKLGEPETCSNVDGSDIRESEMAKICGIRKIAYHDLAARYYYLTDAYTTLKDALAPEAIILLSARENAFAKTEKMGSNLNAKTTAQFLGFFPVTIPLTALAGVYEFTKLIFNELACGLGINDCALNEDAVLIHQATTYLSRSTFSVPTNVGVDLSSLRVVTTGEGKDKNYAEYFITPSMLGSSRLYSDLSDIKLDNDTLLESQLAYFSFHVPQPGKTNVDWDDEFLWDTTPPKDEKYSNYFKMLTARDGGPYPIANSYQGDKNFTLLNPTPPDSEKESGLTADEYDLYTQKCAPLKNYIDDQHAKAEDLYATGIDPVGLKNAEIEFNSLKCSDIVFKYVLTTPPVDNQHHLQPTKFNLTDTDYEEDDKVTQYGPLGCLFSPEWVDGVSVSNWKDEVAVKQESDKWYKGFNKNFNGLLSRAKQGYLKTQDQSNLLKIPCSKDPNKMCYYKYWELGYNDENESKFNLFGSTDGALGPVPINPKNTYFHKAFGDRPYFAIRAMFENMNEKDNATSALEQPIDGSGLRGPFKFVGFWVTAVAPNTVSSRAIYMRITAGAANACRDVAQVVSPVDRKNAAFTDRVWQQSDFTVPLQNYTYGTENAPFGAALHQRMIGHDAMMMLDTTKGFIAPDATFVKAGQEYGLRSRISSVKDMAIYQYSTLSNLFARIYQVYQYYDLPVKKTDKMCFLGPFAGRYCKNGSDCDPITNVICVKDDGTPALGSDAGICKGGARSGAPCTGLTQSSECIVNITPLTTQILQQSCQPVTENGTPKNFKYSVNLNGTSISMGTDCQGVSSTSDDEDMDNNRCTHGVGYYPRPDLCYMNPENEVCLRSPLISGSYFVPMKSHAIASPTDVTFGLYAIKKDLSIIPGSGTSVDAKHESSSEYYDQRFTSGYTPIAPRIAAPDTSRQCTSPGQCAIARMDAINIDNATEGNVIYYGSQSSVTMRFYAWSADNQAPISDVWIDWGDGSMQKVSEARVKNKKPFCGVSKQCEFVPGLTCNSDADCPAAAGKCVGTGFCSNNSGRSCRAGLAGYTDCGEGATCVERLTYGSSPLACEANYFEFKHAYNCSNLQKPAMDCPYFSVGAQKNAIEKSCTVGNNVSNAKTECRFVPRVFVQDNWGWCTGNCKDSLPSSLSLKNPPVSPKDLSLKNGGCYDASKSYSQNTFIDYSLKINMCDAESSMKSRYNNSSFTYDPWIRYNGYIELRSDE